MNIISNLMQLIIEGANSIKSFLNTDFGDSLGALSSVLSALGIELNGITLLSLIGGVGLFALIIYSIIK